MNVIVISNPVIVVEIFYVLVLLSLDLGNVRGVDCMIGGLLYHPNFLVNIENNLSKG